MNNKNYTTPLCPFLGLTDDPETSQNFPSIWNHCHHSQPIAPPTLEHQREICLSGRHENCLVFLRREIAPLPVEILSPVVPTDLKQKDFQRKIIISVASLVAISILTWGAWSGSMFSVVEATQTPSQVIHVTATNTLVPVSDTPLPVTVTDTPFPTLTSPAQSGPTDTPTPFPTATPTNTLSPFDAEIGADYKFVIHKVLSGEDLNQYAQEYNTSVQAILAVNHGITIPVWVNTLVVIPVGFTDYSELPSFVVYQVKTEERGISIEGLAAKLRVDPADLKYYNGWTRPGDRPLVGQYILVPRYDHLLQ